VKKKKDKPYRERRCEKPCEPPPGVLLLTDQQAAYLLGISVRSVRALRAGGKLPSRRTHVGAHPKIPRAAVLRLAGADFYER
jgi:excisionase family DNA binding protein